MKLLFWLMIVFAVIWLLRNKKNRAGSAGPTRPAAGKGIDIEMMVQCAHCGVYVPASESIVAVSGAAYCSEEHRLRHAS